MSTIDEKTREAWRFFQQNAGYAEPPGRAACALDLARAEQRREDAGYVVACEDDTDGWATHGCELPYYVAVLYKPSAHWNERDEVLAAIGGVDVSDAEDPDYWRVLGAELMAEV